MGDLSLERLPIGAGSPLRIVACKEDLSHEPPDALLPEAVATGAEPFLIIGAMAGG
jgi:sulfur-carrier protein